MTKLVQALVVLPFLSTVALAQPATPPNNDTQPRQAVQLSDNQMDKVNAGWKLLETEISNTSITAVSVYQTPHNAISCTSCYINVSSGALSVASIMLGTP